MVMITDPKLYFEKGCGRCERFGTPDCSTRRWIGGLNRLREICRRMGLAETAKWGHPCYMHAGRNIALINAFRDDFRLSFMNAALLSDPEGVLEPNGPNARHNSIIRFTEPDRVAAMAPVISSYIGALKDFAEKGIKPPTQEVDIDIPAELIDAMDNDPELAEAFHDLTPGRQKSYAFNLNAAKTSATRIRRIARFRDHILAGKGALER